MISIAGFKPHNFLPTLGTIFFSLGFILLWNKVSDCYRDKRIRPREDCYIKSTTVLGLTSTDDVEWCYDVTKSFGK